MTHNHPVSFRRPCGVAWCEQAAFTMHKDALRYAAWLSTQIFVESIVRVSGGRDYVDVYYTDGAETVGDELMA